MWGGRREIVWLLKKLCSIVWVRLRYVGVAAHFTALCDVAALNIVCFLSLIKDPSPPN